MRLQRAHLAIVLLVLACASAATRDADAIRAATQRYANLLAAMDNDGIAAMFAPDGVVEIPGGAHVRGPAEIRGFLERFRNYHVLSETMTTDQVTIAGDTANSSGTYHQRVRVPAGNVVEVHGTYAIVWRRAPPLAAWQIEKISTAPAR